MQQARHISFEMQIAPDVETVVLHTNMRQASRALMLLLDNARKFTKQGTVRLILEKTDKMMRFVVEDTGIGLTVSRSIARRLGGDVELDTTYQPGARFVMTLPL